MNNEEIRELVNRVRVGLRVTRVVATRTVRGKLGDTQAGFSAESSLLDSDGSTTPMTLQEAIVANCLLSREADIAAFRNAVAGGNISPEYGKDSIDAIRANYSKLLVQSLLELEST